MRRGITHPLIRYNGFLFGSTLVAGLASYLLNTTAAHRFAPGDYSQFGIALNLLAFCMPFSSAIAGAVLRQASLNRALDDEARTEAVQRFLFYRLSLFCGIGLGVIAVAHQLAERFLRLTTSAPLFLVMVIGYGLTIQASLAAIWQEQGKYGRISLIFLGEGVFRGVFGLAAILLGASIVVVLTIYTVSSVLLIFLFPRPPTIWTGPRASRDTMRQVYRDIRQLAFASFIASALTNFDVVFCRRYLDPVTADHYVAIAAMAKFFLFATGSISTIIFAETIKDEDKEAADMRPLVVSLALLMALGMLFVAFCVLFGPFVTGLAFGSTFRASGAALWITAVSAFAMSLINLAIAYFNALRRSWYLPVLCLGSIATVTALALVQNRLRAYATVYAVGTSGLALILFGGVLVGRFGWPRRGPSATN